MTDINQLDNLEREKEEDNAELLAMLDFSKMKKKKKKKTELAKEDKRKETQEQEQEQEQEIEPKKEQEQEQKQEQEYIKEQPVFEGDYDYNKLLLRIVNEHNAKFKISDTTTRKSIETPIVIREGKKCKFSNFIGFIKSMLNKTKLDDLNEWKHHLALFLFAELNSLGQLLNEQLIFKKVFAAQKIENLVRKYISVYVKCANCGGRNVSLVKCKSTNKYHNNCNVCVGSSICLPDIKLPHNIK